MKMEYGKLWGFNIISQFWRQQIMRILCMVLAILFSFVSTGCYASMFGTVVDAENGKPIEGAVVLVEWTYTSGKWMGLRSTSSYKVVETVTDNEGKFKVSDVLNPFVDTPHITIYKKGFVAWNNEYIFPDYTKRDDFKWTENSVFRLAHFKPEYSYDAHVSFINMTIRSTIAYEKKKLMISAFDWETDLARKEVLQKK